MNFLLGRVTYHTGSTLLVHVNILLRLNIAVDNWIFALWLHLYSMVLFSRFVMIRVIYAHPHVF